MSHQNPQNAAMGAKRRHVMSPVDPNHQWNTPMPGAGRSNPQDLPYRNADPNYPQTPAAYSPRDSGYYYLQESRSSQILHGPMRTYPQGYQRLPGSQVAQGYPQGHPRENPVNNGFPVPRDFLSAADTLNNQLCTLDENDVSLDEPYEYDPNPLESIGMKPKIGNQTLEASPFPHVAMVPNHESYGQNMHYYNQNPNRQERIAQNIYKAPDKNKMHINKFPRSSNVQIFETSPGSSSSSPSDIQGGSHGTEGLECEWHGCSYHGTFGSRGSLERHVQAKHTRPQGFRCAGCDFVNGRRDKVKEHQQKVQHTGIVKNLKV